MLEEEKNIKREYGRNRYYMSEEKKQRLKTCERNYREAKSIIVKNQLIVLSKKDFYVYKGAFKNCSHKDIFH